MSAQQTSWGPPTAGLVGAAMLGVFLGVGAVTLVTDVPGRILIGTAAVGLLLFAAMSWRARPKLTRADIALIRITEFRRIGRKVRLLEIDTTDDRLLVLSRWDLGTDPLHVLDALTETGFAPGQA